MTTLRQKRVRFAVVVGVALVVMAVVGLLAQRQHVRSDCAKEYAALDASTRAAGESGDTSSGFRARWIAECEARKSP